MLNTVSDYGDPSPGASYRLIVTDLNDVKFVLVGAQLTQSSYLSL